MSAVSGRAYPAAITILETAQKIAKGMNVEQGLRKFLILKFEWILFISTTGIIQTRSVYINDIIETLSRSFYMSKVLLMLFTYISNVLSKK
jgi:hypothetical protein